MQNKAILVGGGVSSLVCAYELERKGFEPMIFERNDRLGGRVLTDVVDDYPLDHGFQVLLTSYPAARRYLDYDALDLRNFLPGAVIYKNGKPGAFGDFLRHRSFLMPTLRSGDASLTDKLRVYRHSRRMKKKTLEHIFDSENMSTAEYLNALGMSDLVVDRFIRPFYGGIFLESDLSTSARMFDFVFKMFAHGHASIPAGGIGAIVAQLESMLDKTEIHTNTEVKSIHDGTVRLSDGSTVEADFIAGPPDKYEDAEWHSCTTHYFTSRNNILNKPVIALLPDADAPANSFHFLSDLFGVKRSRHMLSVTCIGSGEASAAEAIEAYFTDKLGLVGMQHVKSYAIRRALPVIKEPRYAPNADDVRLGVGRYQLGDILANASLNAAMESGRVVAEAMTEDRDYK